MLKALRHGVRCSIVGDVVSADIAAETEVFVARRLALLDPVPRLLLRAGECIAAIPAIGAQLPGGREYVGVVAGLATAFSMECQEGDL